MVELTSDENRTISLPPNPVSPTGLVYLPERPNSAEGKIGTGNNYTCTCSTLCNYIVHDVIGDVERKKERKTPEA